MNHPTTSPPAPIVRRAIRAVDGLAVDTRDDADRALSLWAHVDQLTDAEYEQVLAHYLDTTGSES